MGRVDDPVQATVLLRDAGKRLAVREAGRQHTRPFFPIVQYASTWAYKGSPDESLRTRAEIGQASDGEIHSHIVFGPKWAHGTNFERERKRLWLSMVRHHRVRCLTFRIAP